MNEPTTLTPAQQRENQLGHSRNRARLAWAKVRILGEQINIQQQMQAAQSHAKWILDHAAEEKRARIKHLEGKRAEIDAELDTLKKALKGLGR